MSITLLQLAQVLVVHDDERTCPFCTKQTWGADQHEAGCPFALAYLAIRQADLAGTHTLNRSSTE